MVPMSAQGVFVYGVIPAGLVSLLLLAIVLLYYVMGPRSSEVRNARYEAGNPPSGKARGKIGFQYLGYLILFASLEPVAILLFMVSPSLRYSYERAVLVGVAAVAIIIPLLVYGLRYSRDIRRWEW